MNLVKRASSRLTIKPTTMISAMDDAQSASNATWPMPVVLASTWNILLRMVAMGVTIPASREVPCDKIR